MQLKVDKRKLKIFGISILMILSILVAAGFILRANNIPLLFWQNNKCTYAEETYSYSTIDNTLDFISPETPEWALHRYQPVVIDFYTENGVNFVSTEILKFNATECERIDFAVSGDLSSKSFPDVKNTGLIDFEMEKVSFSELQTRIKPGQQIGAYYIGLRPTDEKYDGTCELPGVQVYCAMDEIQTELEEKFTSEEDNIIYLYSPWVITELKKEYLR